MLKLSIALVLLARISLGSSGAFARTTLQRDVEGYAIATCLSHQNEPYLRDQGDAWASVVVQRSHGDVELLHPVQEAVEAELKKGHVAAIYQENDPRHSKTVPVLYCAEIIDEAEVRSAIDTAIKKLAPAYRRAKK